MHALRRLLALFVLTTTPGCASWLINGELPEVLVANVTPLDSTPFEQRLKVDLRVRNPNDFDLQVTGMDFRLDLNGKRFARGLSNREFTVPRLGETVASLETTTSTMDVVRQVLGLRSTQELTYGITGLLHRKEGKLPFDNSGILVEGSELSDLLKP